MTVRNALSAAQRHRAAARHKLFEPIMLRLSDYAIRAHMLDLSSTGALLHSNRPPRIGTAVRIESESFVASAKVIWVQATRFGIRFDTSLSATCVDHALARGTMSI